jgi:hypothetical protein
MLAKNYAVTLVFLASVAAAQAAAPVRPDFLEYVRIEQKDRQVSVFANSPRPLDQAIEAIRREYGWVIDYEDPVYAPSDLVDDTDPTWRESHPNGKGVTRVAGGVFRAELSMGNDMSIGSSDEESVLDKTIADYRTSGNPGAFILKREDDNRYAVVGVDTKHSITDNQQVAPVFNSRIAIPLRERTIAEALEEIVRAVSQKSGITVELGEAPVNLIVQTRLKIGGEERPAREFLTQLASATRFPTVWRLLYDADPGMYFLSLQIATQSAKDGSSEIPLRSTLKQKHSQ